MTACDRVKLLFGPYRPPCCRVGGTLFYELRARVPVRRISPGPVPWPITWKRGGKRSSILCGNFEGGGDP